MGDWGGYNNKWKLSGSGTTSCARKQRIQAAAQERGRKALLGDPEALKEKAAAEARKAKSLQETADKAAAEAAATQQMLRAAEEEVSSKRQKKKQGPCQKEPAEQKETKDTTKRWCKNRAHLAQR